MSSGYSSIVGVVYLVAGPVVASSHAFFASLNALMPILSAVLAVVLWPLVLLGVDYTSAEAGCGSNGRFGGDA